MSRGLTYRGISLETLYTDAARWRFVRDNLAQASDLKMDGLSRFYFRHPKGRARTIDELIDSKIEESKQ